MYNSETGDFFWITPKKGRMLFGLAGTTSPSGYRNITIDGHTYGAHRLAYLYMTGKWPPEYIDHKDGNPRNNAWNNLRPASKSQNAQNKRRKYDSFTGIKGVVKDFLSDTWTVQISHAGINYRMGPFFSYQDACHEYDKKAQELFDDFAKKEIPRRQRASFRKDDVSKAIDEFIATKQLTSGEYV